LWTDDVIVSVSLSGSIHYVDENNTNAPKKTLLGHNKIISSVAYCSATKKAFSADTTGYVVEWNADNGDTRTFKGAGHTASIKQIVVNSGKLVSISIDDSVKFSSTETLEYGDSVALGGQPTSVDSKKEWTVVSTSAGIVVLNGTQIVSKLEVTYSASSIALSTDATHVAVGAKDGKIHVYTLNGGKLVAGDCIEGHTGEVTTLAYSHDGKYLAAGDASREVKVWEGKNSKAAGWVFHTSRIQSVSWAPDNIHLVSGSVDSAVIVWNVAQQDKRIHQKLAHIGGVRGVAFQDNNTVLSVGEDCAMKSWSLTY